eukprot:3629365-Amphidinium_carterae.1
MLGTDEHGVLGRLLRHPGDWENFASRGFIARDKPREAPYWPPPEVRKCVHELKISLLAL